MELRICINTANIAFDNDVMVKIDLPFVPTAGDIIYLTNDQREVLREKIIKKGDYISYCSCFYGKSIDAKKLEDYDIKDLSVEDWIYVEGVAIDAGSGIIWVGLNDG